MNKNVLITGGAGFVGSVLTSMLLERGDHVRIVDTGLFGLGHVPSEVDLFEADVTDFDPKWLDGVDSVVHLAGLSNDPMAEYSPKINYQLNAAGTAIVAHYSKMGGVARFIQASTCSVYGMNDAKLLEEDAECVSKFPYAVSKLMAERALLALEDDNFRPIILRKGTVIGASTRMRFDLAANTMVKFAISSGKIDVHNPDIWRPILDVRDAATAYIRAIDAPSDVSGIFNIASDNYTIGALADEVASVLREFGHTPEVIIGNHAEQRSYRASTEKARQILGFDPIYSVADSVVDVMKRISSGEFEDVTAPQYNNITIFKEALGAD